MSYIAVIGWKRAGDLRPSRISGRILHAHSHWVSVVHRLSGIISLYYINLNGYSARGRHSYMAATGLGDPVHCGNGRGSPYYYCSVYYRKVTKSPWIFPKPRSHHRILPKLQGHRGFSGKVTQSQP